MRPVSAVPADRLRYVDQLGKLTGETVNLSARAGDHITHIYHAESHFVLRPNFPLYAPFPAYSTSVGRVFLSYMSDASIEWIYENNKEEIGTSVDEFLAMRIRRAATAARSTTRHSTRVCAAWPPRYSSPRQSPLFAISISAPLSRMDDASYAQARQLVIDYAARISQEIQSVEYRP